MRETAAGEPARARGSCLTLLALFVLVPVYVMLSSSLKPLSDVQGALHVDPAHLTLRPYVDIWKTVPLGALLRQQPRSSSAVATVCSVVLAIFAAYAVSRYRFRGRRLFTVTVLSTQMFPGILFLLPLFLIFVNIGNSTGIDALRHAGSG